MSEARLPTLDYRAVRRSSVGGDGGGTARAEPSQERLSECWSEHRSRELKAGHVVRARGDTRLQPVIYYAHSRRRGVVFDR